MLLDYPDRIVSLLEINSASSAFQSTVWDSRAVVNTGVAEKGAIHGIVANLSDELQAM